ncbi:MAG: PilZ domain-containing protein [Bacillota bacterium]|nr:PilZ domain-containing protein [Bacillota bacterium]
MTVVRITGGRQGAGVHTLGHHLALALQRLGMPARFEDRRGRAPLYGVFPGEASAALSLQASWEPLPEEKAVIWVLLAGDPLPEGPPSQWLLFNRKEDKEEPGEGVLGSIPEDPCFERAAQEGKDLFALCPEGEGAKALLRVARRLQALLEPHQPLTPQGHVEEDESEPAFFSKELPRPNQKVVLRDERGESFASFVEEVAGSALTVAIPMRGMVALKGEVGSSYLLEYGDGMAVFQFPAALAAVGAGSWHLQVAEKGVRRQRRRYLRWPVVLPVKVVLEGRTLEGRTADISGGGLLAVLPQWIPPGKKVAVVLQLPDRSIRGEARVVRELSPLPQGYRFGLEWVNLRMADEDAIVRFIFRQQQKARRHGVL